MFRALYSTLFDKTERPFRPFSVLAPFYKDLLANALVTLPLATPALRVYQASGLKLT